MKYHSIVIAAEFVKPMKAILNHSLTSCLAINTVERQPVYSKLYTYNQ